MLERLAPDHKTIANFRKDNSAAFVGVCAAFVTFARSKNLIGGSVVAIDGSKIRAVASSKAVMGRKQLDELAARQAKDIAIYLHDLDRQDHQDSGHSQADGDVAAALAQLRRQGGKVNDEVQRLVRGGMLVTSEPQAQVMRSLHSAPGYNLQTAVDTDVTHDVNNEGNDQRQLQPMAQAARASLAQARTVIADAGYANGEHLAELAKQGITAYVAPNPGVNNQGAGNLYDKRAFAYDPATDSFICPAGKTLKRKQVYARDKVVIYAAQASDCQACTQKASCTQAKQRCVSRHFHEEALAANAKRVASSPHMMAPRRQTVEHPFGTIKHQILGNARLLRRGLRGATAELSLAVLAYNLKRVSNMTGRQWLLQALGA